MPKVSLISSDNQKVEFDCSFDETVVDAAEKAGYYLQAQCNQGSCGACLAQSSKPKDFFLSSYDKDILNNLDISSGKTLLCRTQVVTDTTFTLPYPRSLICENAPQKREASISKIEILNPNTRLLVLQLHEHSEFGLGFDFEPGQFANINIPNTDISRPYSMGNAPGFTGELEFYIKLRKNGKFSTFLEEKSSIGQAITLEGPHGSFILHDNGLKPRLFIAGGCGLASVLAMLRRMAEWQDPQPVTLLFGVWQQEELFALEEIKALNETIPQLNVRIFVAEAQSESCSFPIESSSLIDALKLIINKKTTNTDVYICGSSGLVNTCKDYCLSQDVDERNIYFEHFNNY
ncbi:MAG: FAD-binding oxidoreductase [Oligoflexales bacterium]